MANAFEYAFPSMHLGLNSDVNKGTKTVGIYKA